ncbi:hypothetical protein PFISCL1PPCAC_22478, partial [Pristionchus fissidentatus]
LPYILSAPLMCLAVLAVRTPLRLIVSILEQIACHYGCSSSRAVAHYQHEIGGRVAGQLLDPYGGSEWMTTLLMYLCRYPEARTVQRKIFFHAGPTNSGKTYHALKRY